MEDDPLQKETRLIFSSLQTHINKVCGSQMPPGEIPPGDIQHVDPTGRSIPTFLSQQQKRDLKCTAVEGCVENATYFANMGGQESLCCAEHGVLFRSTHRNQNARGWFCRELVFDKGDECMWFIAWKIPQELRDAFGLLVWLWYPIPDAVDGGETNCFNIYKKPDESIDLPPQARWEKISSTEAARLIGQLFYESQRGQAPFVIGFAPDEPFDRPDPSLGFSVAKHSYISDMSEPFCFNHKKMGAYENVSLVWRVANIIEYKPERGTIRAIRN